MRIFVITPTYNERKNIGRLISGVFGLGIPDLDMVVVDDNSPDGTAKVAEDLSKKYPVRVLKRDKKEGLGRAYVHAFKEILKGDPDIIIQMDADLSHDSAVIPKMIDKIKTSKADVVLGSRYVQGGKIENWDKIREIVSRGGNFYARLVLGLSYRDITGGFKCWRAEVLKNMDLDSLSSLGYNFQIETTYRAHKAGRKIVEIPIIFTERKTGVSKFNIGIILESFWKVLLLKINSKIKNQNAK